MTLFPGAIDTLANPTAADSLSSPAVLHHVQHANENDAITAIESYLLSGAGSVNNFVAATAGFHGTNASGTIASSGISVSVAAGAPQTNQTIGWYASSNTTLTSSGTADARTLSVRAIGSLTVGFSNGELLLSAANALTTAALSGDTSKYLENWKLTGNTSGTTSSAQGTDLWLAGGNGVTISGSSNTLSFSVATNYQSQGAYLTTADLSQNSSKYVQNWKLTGNTSGTTSSAEGTDLWFSGGNGVTLSGSSNSIVVSVATNYQSQGAYLTTAALSGDTTKYMQNWKLTGNTAGTTSSAEGTDLWFSGGNNVTLSGSSNTIVVSVPTPAAQTNQAGTVYASSNTFGTSSGTYDARTLSIAGSGAVSVAASNSGWVISAPTQTNQTEGIYLTGNTTANSTSRTVDARSLSISGAGAVSVGWDTAASQLVISGGTVAAGSLSLYGLGNTSGTSSGTGAGTLSINAIGGAISVAASNSGWNLSVPQTSSLSATGWAQISTNGSTISIGATTTANLYAAGNTSGTSSGTADIRTISISGVSPVQVAASNSGWNVGLQQISFFEPVPWNAVNSATTSQGIGTLGVQPFVLEYPCSFAQLNMIVSGALSGTFGGSANTITVSIGGASSFGFSATGGITNFNILSIVIFSKGSGSNSDMLFSLSTTSCSINTAFNNVINVSATGGAASWSASLLSSMSVSVSWPTMTSGQAINGASSWTTWAPGYTNSNSSTTASAGLTTSTSVAGGSSLSVGSAFPGNLSSFWQSNKIIPIPFAVSLTPGEYWLGIWRTTNSSSGLTTANANVGANHSYTSAVNWSAGTSTAQLTWCGSTASLVNSLGWLGAASQATMGPSPGMGTFSTTYATNTTYANAANQPVGAVALSQINTAVSFFRSYLQFANTRI